MISKIVFFLVVVPLAILLIAFAVANRQAVPVTIDPLGLFPQLGFSAPLFVLLLGGVILGVVLGGIGTWLTQTHYRREAAQRKHENDKLRREADEARERARRLEEERASDRQVAGRDEAGSRPLIAHQAA